MLYLDIASTSPADMINLCEHISVSAPLTQVNFIIMVNCKLIPKIIAYFYVSKAFSGVWETLLLLFLSLYLFIGNRIQSMTNRTIALSDMHIRHGGKRYGYELKWYNMNIQFVTCFASMSWLQEQRKGHYEFGENIYILVYLYSYFTIMRLCAWYVYIYPQ